jgi:hypothetical protein
LALAEWPKLSNRALAEMCAVSYTFVGEIRGNQVTTLSPDVGEIRGNQVTTLSPDVGEIRGNQVTTLSPESRTGREGKTYPLPVSTPPIPQSPPTQTAAKEPTTSPLIPRQPADSPKPPVRKDHTGWIIPTKVIEKWDYAEESQELLSQLSALRGAIRAASEHDHIEWSEVNFSSLLAHLDQAYADLKRAKPYAVCPTCQGRVSEQCQMCKGRGFISEFYWSTAVPQQVKDIRAKAIKS